MEAQPVFGVEIQAEMVDEISELCAMRGARLVPTGHGLDGETRGPEAIHGVIACLVVGIVGVRAMAHLAVELADHVRGGLVLNLRDDRTQLLLRTRDVPYGYIVIFTADGRVTVDIRETNHSAALPDLLRALTELRKATASQVQETINRAGVAGVSE